MTTKQKSDYDWCAHPGALENVKTGASTPTKTPLADGVRKILAGGAGVSIAVEGTDHTSTDPAKCYVPGISIGEDSNNGPECSLQNAKWPKNADGSPGELIVGGLDAGANVAGIFVTQKSGISGPLRVENVKLTAKGVSLYAIESAQGFSKPHGGFSLFGVVFLATDPTIPNDVAAYFGARFDCSDYYWLEQCAGTDFQQYMAYCDNSQSDSRVLNCQAKRCGRGLWQSSNRQWTDAANTNPTNNPSTPETAKLVLQGNSVYDCSSYQTDPTDPAKGWTANGSAFAVQDWLGDVDFIGNTIYQTHPGGGGLFFGHDAKAGSFKRADGFRLGLVRVSRNQIYGYAGAHASRDMEMFGAMKRLELGGNRFNGNLPSVLLDHTGKIGTVAATVAKLSDPGYWGDGPKIRRELPDGTLVVLSNAQIDALYSTATPTP